MHRHSPEWHYTDCCGAILSPFVGPIKTLFFVNYKYANKPECYITISCKALQLTKCSSLLGPFVSSEDNKVL
jgi:hypothetical protein